MLKEWKSGLGPIAVAIPARNEAARIADCLSALDAQQNAVADHIVLCVNNSNDDTAAIARRFYMRSSAQLHVIECHLPVKIAHAGTARRLAMEEAYRLVGDEGVVLTTDADGTVDETWIDANLKALRAGADAVAGWVDLDQASFHAIPMRLHEDDARECAYDALCDEIHGHLDPDPADPLPRHTQHSGASLAVTGAMYRQAGGMPAVAHGEDRAFVAALRRADARIRHAPEVHVTVSGRTEGRAKGGMADTIRRRMSAPDLFLDDRLEPAENCARRARLRRALRLCLSDSALVAPLAAELGLPADLITTALVRTGFGTTWAMIEQQSAILVRHKVPVGDLPAQMRRAQQICGALRRCGGSFSPMLAVAE